MSAYTDAVARGLARLGDTTPSSSVCPGVCPSCTTCACELGFESVAAYADPFFSWRPCDICGSSLGGNREVYHYLRGENRTIEHGASMCTDCVVYLATGDEPTEWERS
jgi:ferredoxin